MAHLDQLSYDSDSISSTSDLIGVCNDLTDVSAKMLSAVRHLGNHIVKCARRTQPELFTEKPN